jgi:hypothetical protein
MKSATQTADVLTTTIRTLSLPDLDRRLADLDAERAALSTLRRSLVARDKVKRRATRQPANAGQGGRDA